MLSNIILFLLFSLIAVAILNIISEKYKKYVLLFFNILFYALCDLKFLFLICLGIIWSYHIGFHISKKVEARKFYLGIGIIPLVASLFFFKYFNFFIPPNNDVLKIVMPLGISYYTFKIISYLVDIYQGKMNEKWSIIEYSVYISFFPQIICGPISRSEEIMKQIRQISKTSAYLFSNGFHLILSGLFKKLVIADRLSPYVNNIFDNPSGYPALALWMGAFFYSIQIYCDFAGYSEIAIGVTNLMGIECNPNFNLPYFSYSIKDFWRRWHISLSSWLRDYVYIPLGGNKKGKIQKKFNILVTFFVSGVWHGNGLNYVFWGIYHGIFNLFSIQKASVLWKRILQMLSTFFIVMIGWIFFKATTLKVAFSYILKMFTKLSIDFDIIVVSILPFTGDFSCLAYFLCACIFIMIWFVLEYRDFTGKIKDMSKERTVRAIIYFSSIVFFGFIGQASFLYANF